MDKALRFCRHPGCSALVTGSYCAKHAAEHEAERRQRWAEADKRRGNAQARGYGSRWQKYSRAYLRRPENQICRLNLPGCTRLATCVDHIDPPDSAKDPRFWDKSNHQPACRHCNSVKGHRKIKGEFDLV